MTLDEFLDDYVPRVLRPMGGWKVLCGGMIRRYSGYVPNCPLTAEMGTEPATWYRAQTPPLNLRFEDAKAIVAAADHEPFRGLDFNPKIRARLLAGLGLKEQ